MNESALQLGIDEIDLSDLEFWTLPPTVREKAFATLRSQRPIPFFKEPEITGTAIEVPSGPGYFVLTRHADVVEASRHPELYCSGRGATNIPDMPDQMLEFFGSMINMDDPRHARLRRIVSAAFTPKTIKAIEANIHKVAAEVVDNLADSKECDFVTEVAAKLPLTIICDMMGVPKEDREKVFTRSNVILSMGDPEYVPEGTDPILAFLQAGQDLASVMESLSSQRLGNPTDDLTSALVNANVDGESLSHDELASFFILLVVAGNETTRNAISHGLLALSEHPQQSAAWAADPASISTTAVDEIVRWASPVIFMRRTVTRDTVLSGQVLKEGSKVLLLYASANRDEEVFADPFNFDIRRNPNPHVGFGGPGPHFCLGAHLARKEIAVMFEELLGRMKDIEVTGEPSFLRSSFINGIKHLPCRFTPA